MFCGETIVPEGLTGLQLSFNFTVRVFLIGANHKLMMLPHMLPNLVVSRLAFCSSHIQLVHADVHFDVPLDIEFGQKENRFHIA